MRRVLFWLVLVVFSAGVLLGGLEVLLQAGAWWVRATGREVPVAWMTDEVRVLCLGDSNTYGLYLDPVDSYPGQLETTWNESGSSPKLEVYNLGFPGTNSSNVLADFERMVDSFQPHVVVLMIGANDFWTVPSKLAEPSGSPRTILEFIERHSRLYRLVYMLERANSHDELQAPRNRVTKSEAAEGVVRREFVFGDEVFEVGMVRDTDPRTSLASRRMLSKNLAAIVRLARERNTRLVLMSYPSQRKRGFYALANRELARTARESRLPFVDLRAAFSTRCSDSECGEWLFRDQHPNAAGYGIIAGEVSRKLSELLAE